MQRPDVFEASSVSAHATPQGFNPSQPPQQQQQQLQQQQQQDGVAMGSPTVVHSSSMVHAALALWSEYLASQPPEVVSAALEGATGVSGGGGGALYGPATAPYPTAPQHTALAGGSAPLHAFQPHQQQQFHPQQQQQQQPHALPQSMLATASEPTELNDQQWHQILDHVNKLIEFCGIPQKNGNERITSIRQCSSSFFVLLCQRIFDGTIAGICIPPYTAEKKRNNVSLVLEELVRRGYNVDGISADEVVQLNEVHLSRLIMLFVGIAQELGLDITSGTVESGAGTSTHGYHAPPPPPPPYGPGFTAPPDGVTVAEIAAGTHFPRQGVVTPSGQVYTAAGIVEAPLAGPGEAPFYGYDGANDVQQLNYLSGTPGRQYPNGGGGDMYGQGGGYYAVPEVGPGAEREGVHEDGDVQTSGYDDSQTPSDEAMGEPYDDDALRRQELVHKWWEGLVPPEEKSTAEANTSALRPTHVSSAHPQRPHHHHHAQQHQQQPQQQTQQQPRSSTMKNALLREAHDVGQRIKRVEESIAADQQQQQQQQQQLQHLSRSGGDGPAAGGILSSSQKHQRRYGASGSHVRRLDRDGTIPTPSSSFTETSGPGRRPATGPPRTATTSAGQRPRGQSKTAAGRRKTDPATAGRRPPRSYPLEEPPLTRVECRLLASHPRSLIDASARDGKIARLRTARFLQDAQVVLRQRLRDTHDAATSEMRAKLTQVMKESDRDMLYLKRKVRDEDEKYRAAYRTLIESAANEARVPRHAMSSHTVQLADYYDASLMETQRMCDYLQQEHERRNLAEVVSYAQMISGWQQRMPV